MQMSNPSPCTTPWVLLDKVYKRFAFFFLLKLIFKDEVPPWISNILDSGRHFTIELILFCNFTSLLIFQSKKGKQDRNKVVPQ